MGVKEVNQDTSFFAKFPLLHPFCTLCEPGLKKTGTF
jgi:hypothetical protein